MMNKQDNNVFYFNVKLISCTKIQAYETPIPWVPENGFDGWVGQGDYKQEHWAQNYDYVCKNVAVLQYWCC